MSKGVSASKLHLASVQEAFSEYHNISPLARGGQGTAFVAVSPDEQQVVIKIYNLETSLIARGKMEARKLQTLQSPFIVNLIDCGNKMIRDMEWFYTVTTFEAGKDLQYHLDQIGVLDEDDVRQLICEIGSGIDSLWTARVVHCDIKPSNILIAEDGTFKLVDLGFAKHLDIDSLTKPGEIFGTWGYMAPELQLGRKNLTLRVDIFALGIVAYESLTGQHPFHRDQRRIFGEMQIPVRPSLLTTVSANLERVIGQMLNPNPIHRPRSGEQLIKLLERG